MDIRKLAEWNPWWQQKGLLEELKGKDRPDYEMLVNSVEIKEITIITGVRRSGKSTLMYQMISNLLRGGIIPEQILFVNLEDKKLLHDSLEEIYCAYREEINLDKKAYIFLDEIHRREDWESWVRKKYDLKENIKFVISGSCSYLLKKEYSTLLTGRNLTFEVFPLSFSEFLLFKGNSIDPKSLKKMILLEKTIISIMKSFREYREVGGFPEILFKQEEYKMKVLEQYFDDILYKDIIDRYNLNSQKVKDLALFLITNFTSLVSLRSLRNSLELSYDTLKDYLSYYMEAFLFFRVDHFSYSFKEQKTLPSKIYCIDTGLRNSVSFTFSRDEGKLVENCVLVELKRRGNDVYYWKNKGEVDFIIKHKDQSLTAINVSFTDEIDDREFKALTEFKRTFKKTKEFILLTKTTEKKQQGIECVPVWKWLLMTSRK